jgi:putative flippase GtrA
LNTGSGRAESLTAIFQAARFSIVGVSNTLIDAALFFALTQALAAPILPAKWLSYSAGLANSFFWNRRWTFRAEINTARAAPQFLALNLVGLLANAGLMALGLHVLQLPLPVAWLAATAGAWLWNFWSCKQLFVNS